MMPASDLYFRDRFCLNFVASIVETFNDMQALKEVFPENMRSIRYLRPNASAILQCADMIRTSVVIDEAQVHALCAQFARFVPPTVFRNWASHDIQCILLLSPERLFAWDAKYKDAIANHLRAAWRQGADAFCGAAFSIQPVLDKLSPADQEYVLSQVPSLQSLLTQRQWTIGNPETPHVWVGQACMYAISLALPCMIENVHILFDQHRHIRRGVGLFAMFQIFRLEVIRDLWKYVKTEEYAQECIEKIELYHPDAPEVCNAAIALVQDIGTVCHTVVHGSVQDWERIVATVIRPRFVSAASDPYLHKLIARHFDEVQMEPNVGYGKNPITQPFLAAVHVLLPDVYRNAYTFAARADIAAAHNEVLIRDPGTRFSQQERRNITTNGNLPYAAAAVPLYDPAWDRLRDSTDEERTSSKGSAMSRASSASVWSMRSDSSG